MEVVRGQPDEVSLIQHKNFRLHQKKGTGEEKVDANIFIYGRKRNMYVETRSSQEILRPYTNPLLLSMGISLFPVPC